MVKFIFFIENRKICDEVECLTDHLCICFYTGVELINFQEGEGKFFIIQIMALKGAHSLK